MKKSWICGLVSAGFVALYGIRRRQAAARYPGREPKPAKSEEVLRTERAVQACMVGLIIPVWIGAGLLDYLCHRRTRIETTSGTRESLLHLIMLCQGGPMALAPLVLEANAGLIALLAAFYFAHQATAFLDVDSTVSERLVTPGEQLVHGYLEGAPFCIATLYMAMNWNQTLALFGLNAERPRFALCGKQPVVPVRDVAMVTAAVIALDFLPHVEEFARCLRARQSGLTGRDTPACAPILFGPESSQVAAA
jgi:hypothetical protein